MKIGVVFGGRSCEHDISIISGIMTINAASERHEVVPIYIDGCGDWWTAKHMISVKVFADGLYKKKSKRVHLRPNCQWLFCQKGKKVHKLDVVIICTHGKNGEDGCLAGLLEMSGIAYAGSGVLASAVGMDKIMQKQVLRDAGFKVVRFFSVEKGDVDGGLYDLVGKVEKIGFPLILKPSNLGSSIGIIRVSDFKELFDGLKQAFCWDERVLVEEALEDFTEYNCAVLGASGGKSELILSEIEEPISDGFLGYSEKYELFGGSKADGSGEYKSASKGCMGRYLPARADADLRGEIFEAARGVFRLLGCSGVARVDFLFKDGQLYVNEINTVPGSMSNYLFEFGGLSFSGLVDRLIRAAMDECKRKGELKLKFDSNVLKGSGGAKG